MRKLYLLGLLALAGSIIGFAWAEEITLSTYYPAPYGVYKTMQANTLYLQPIDPDTLKPVDPTVDDRKDGMLISDMTDGNKIKYWDGQEKAWRTFVSFLEQIIVEKTLEADFYFSDKRQQILNLDDIEILRGGLYSLSWSGYLDIKAPKDKAATIEVYRGSSREYQAEYEDDADTDPNTYTNHDISGGSFLFLKKGKYSFKVKGYCKQGDAILRKDFTIQLYLLMPL